METTAHTLSGLEPLMSIEELSEYLHAPVRTLYAWRLAGEGPCEVHPGRQLRYFVSDVHAWLASSASPNPVTRPKGCDSSWLGPGHRSGRSVISPTSRQAETRSEHVLATATTTARCGEWRTLSSLEQRGGR